MFPDRVRVLITEDDADSREMLCLLLREHHIEGIPADSAQEAIGIAKTEQFDAYLIDNRLPDISGPELCKRIRQFDGHTPIVFYSGDSDQSRKDEAFLAGAQGYVVKPASCEDIVAAIVAAMDCGTPKD
jgi:DNA-binding response OmpR family regulator